MSNFSFRLAAIPLIILGVLVLSVKALGQTDRVSPIAAPCQERDASHRPTLKRQQPTPDDSNPKEVAPKSDEKENCKPQDEPEIVKEPVKEEGKLVIKFEGLVDVDESDLRKELHESRVQLPKDPTLETDLVEKASSAVKERLIARGYRHAVVNTRVDRMNPDSKALVFIVIEGIRPGIAEFRFEGNIIFPTEQLAGEIRRCMVGYERDYYDPNVFDYCIRRLDNSARSHGDLQPHFYVPKFANNPATLIVTLQADEGILYRLGEIKIDGAFAFPDEKIRTMLGMQTGDIANGEQLWKALYEELKKVYGEK